MTFDDLQTWAQAQYPWPAGDAHKPFMLLIDDIDVLELLAAGDGDEVTSTSNSRHSLRKWMSGLIYHVQRDDITEVSTLNSINPVVFVCKVHFSWFLQGLQSVIVYGRTPAESQLSFPSMDNAQPQQVLDHSEGHRAPVLDGQPLIAEYLRYR